VLALVVVAGALDNGGHPPPQPAVTVQAHPQAPSEPATPDTPTPTTTPTPTPTTGPATGEPGTALALLARLPVEGRAPKTGYSRDQFGQAWADTDRNGCDTRNDILRRDLTNRVMKAGTGGCVVLAGTLVDLYAAATIRFIRGGGSEVDIDHMVALSDAWQKGAQAWPSRKRLAFANDPLELLAVSSSANRQKGDSDAASWLPPNKAFRCAYVARQVAVKAKFGLWVTPAERDAIRRVLSRCPGQPAPTGGNPTMAPFDAPVTRTTATATPMSAGTTAAGTDPRFSTCAAAKAAVYGPYRQGIDPEYAWYRDADHDGIVCE
jgi:hypothetical protein